MSTFYCYVDLEGQGEHMVEFAALAVDTNTGKTKILHLFIKPGHVDARRYYLEAKNSHCISLATLNSKGVERANAEEEFKLFLLSLTGTVVIKGNGSDMGRPSMETLFPQIDFSIYEFSEVNLPGWEFRLMSYHDQAFAMKSQNGRCGPRNHTILFSPTWLVKKKKFTPARNARLLYGHHCALADVHELAFYERLL